ncbi:MAG: fumarylacetoacetase [Pseudomonadota bacterium]
MTALLPSWIETANDPNGDFPLNNLPYGVFSTPDEPARCGVAIGAQILDLAALEAGQFLDFGGTLQTGSWNAFMARGAAEWARLRDVLTEFLRHGAEAEDVLGQYLVAQADAGLHLPFSVTEYTDFYASYHHASNVGTMFRGAENALPPNWLHIPIGYNGRASSVVVSGTPITRPFGQLKGPTETEPRFAPSERFDFELEMGAIVGQPTSGRLSVAEADAAIFGYVILNDWSARDIQAWEYQPLGPFQSKATATTISPWIVTTAALRPFRAATPEREVPLLPHLKEPGPMLYDIALSIELSPENGPGRYIAETNYREMYYSSAQQLAHHASSGCPMRVGDLLGSGTISGPNSENRGSMLELSWGGKEPVEIADGVTRRFLEDGDTVTMRGAAHGDGHRIGFGACKGTLRPAER